MNERYYLAIDMGASGGRHILGYLRDGKLILEEIYRFANGAKSQNGSLVWDTDRIFNEILNGLKKCKSQGKIPYSIGIDTWGVDYALLDKNDKLLEPIFCYRDDRTINAMKSVHQRLKKDELYSRSGIQSQQFNTIYQLYDDLESGKLKRAETFLLLPEYFNFLLTGIKKNEYTNATTTGLINAVKMDWDEKIISSLNYPSRLFKKLYTPQTVVGDLSQEIQQLVGFNAKVVLPCTHDTASAVASVPSFLCDSIYISSGTWSLMGVELDEANTCEQSNSLKYSNEGGLDFKFRFLKNIMGLWIIQCVKSELNDEFSFAELVNLARNCSTFESLIDVNDNRFFTPDNMIGKIKDYCKETNQKVPNSAGELAFCVYNSLAKAYKESAEELEKLTNKSYDTINIVGGGSKNTFLSELTALYSKKRVVAGPTEATAIGNIIVQMRADGSVKDRSEAKQLIKNSFEFETFNV